MRCCICDRETNDFHKEPNGKWVSICNNCKSIIKDTARKNYEDIDEQDFIDAKLASMSSLEFIKFVDRRTRCHSKKNLKSLVTNTD